jgi:hypothetical protein
VAQAATSKGAARNSADLTDIRILTLNRVQPENSQNFQFNPRSGTGHRALKKAPKTGLFSIS